MVSSGAGENARLIYVNCDEMMRSEASYGERPRRRGRERSQNQNLLTSGSPAFQLSSLRKNWITA